MLGFCVSRVHICWCTSDGWALIQTVFSHPTHSFFSCVFRFSSVIKDIWAPYSLPLFFPFFSFFPSWFLVKWHFEQQGEKSNLPFLPGEEGRVWEVNVKMRGIKEKVCKEEKELKPDWRRWKVCGAMLLCSKSTLIHHHFALHTLAPPISLPPYRHFCWVRSFKSSLIQAGKCIQSLWPNIKMKSYVCFKIILYFQLL